jgi:hypothetical protein
VPKATPWLYIFNGIPTNYAPAANAAALQVLNVKTLKGKRVAWVYVDSPGVVPIASLSRSLIEKAGGAVVADIRNPLTGLTSFASQAANIVNARPDIVLGIDLQGNVTTAVPALRTAGYNGPIVVVGEGANGGAIFRQLKDGNFYSSRQYRVPNPSDLAHKVANAQGYGGAIQQAFFSLGWQMGNAASVALAKCGYPCSASKFLKVTSRLSKIEFDGELAMSRMSFTPKKHWAPTSLRLFKWNPSVQGATGWGKPVSISSPPPAG